MSKKPDEFQLPEVWVDEKPGWADPHLKVYPIVLTKTDEPIGRLEVMTDINQPDRVVLTENGQKHFGKAVGAAVIASCERRHN